MSAVDLRKKERTGWCKVSAMDLRKKERKKRPLDGVGGGGVIGLSLFEERQRFRLKGNEKWQF